MRYYLTPVRTASIKKSTNTDFPGGLVVKTLCLQCRRCGFDPRSGNLYPTCHAAWQKVQQTSKKSINNKFRRGCGERQPSYTVGGNMNLCSHYGEQSGHSFKKFKNKTITWSRNVTRGHGFLDKPIIIKDIYTLMFIAVLFRKAKTWK